MKFDIGAIFEQIVGFYAKLPLAQKIALPLLVLGSIFAIVFVSRWATQPAYTVLFSDLDDSDASGIVDTLKDLKIKYQVADNGTTIKISPPELVHELRLQLAGKGLPAGKQTGFELFDKQNIGQSAFEEAVKFLRSNKGELERSIGTIEAVRSVRVHITNPKPSVFAKRSVPPTASVLLKLKPGAELSKLQIKGITHLVANSIERLAPENVTIIDQHGNMLNDKPDPNDLSGADLTHLEYQQKIESAYSKRIETMLAEILGPGRSVARVTAEVNFNRFEKEEEAYDPAGIVTRSERSVSEAAGLTAEGGVPGVISNLTNDPGVLTPPDSSQNQNRRSETVRNFEVSRAVSRTVSAPGRIERLSVAVLVDGQYINPPGVTGSDPAAQKKLYKPLPAEMLRKIEGLVKQAVGFDGSRGDLVTVENMRFVEPDEEVEEALQSAERDKKIQWGVGLALPVLLAFLFFWVLVRPLVSFLVTPTESEVDLSRLLPAGIEELEAELEAERSKLSALPERAVPAVDIEELEGLLAENSRMVRENPQQAALLIRYWLNEGKV